MQRHQLAQLRELVAHAAATVPIYRKADYRNWLHGNDEAVWAAYPICRLSRGGMRQEAGVSLYASAVPERHGKVSEDETSGSTGVPLRYRTTALAGFRLECLSRCASISGTSAIFHCATPSSAVDRRRPCADLGGAVESNFRMWRIGQFSRQPITDGNAGLAEAMNPQYLMTTPSALRTLAEIAIETSCRCRTCAKRGRWGKR